MFCGSTSNCASAMERRQASRAVEHREGCLEGPSPEVRSLTKLAKSCKVVEIRKSYHVGAVNPRLAKEPAEDLPLFESRNPEMSELLETAARAAAGDANTAHGGMRHRQGRPRTTDSSMEPSARAAVRRSQLHNSG